VNFQKKIKTRWSLDKYKAKLIAKGYRQKERRDYFDRYSQVTRIASIQMLIAIVVLHNLDIHQMNIKTAFLNGKLNKKIYME